jgi:predicted RNA binding protein YcfA (HicA-like mRNA interferase family)
MGLGHGVSSRNVPLAVRPLLVIIDWMKVRDVIRLIEADGWRLVATRGSHRQYKHARKPGRVTVAGNPGHELAPGTVNSVLKQAGLK